MTSPAASPWPHGRWAGRRDSTTPPRSARTARPTSFETSATPKPCSRPCFRDGSSRRARAQGPGGRPGRAPAGVDRGRRRARLPRRDARLPLRSQRASAETRRSRATARVPSSRSVDGMGRTRLEGARGKARRLSVPRGVGVACGRSARGARCAPSPRLQDRAPDRRRRGAVPAGRRNVAPGMVSGNGCIARGRRATARHRARHRGNGAAARVVSSRIAAVFRGRLREADRPPCARVARRLAMNPPMKLLMPLRVPELAPSLGRIIVPRRLFDPWVPVDDLEAAAARAGEASVLEKDAHALWQDALRTVARRLEAAWLALEAEVDAERERWTPEIDQLAAWRPSLWPVIIGWLPLGVLLLWLGLILSGYVPAPAWLAPQLGLQPSSFLGGGPPHPPLNFTSSKCQTPAARVSTLS